MALTMIHAYTGERIQCAELDGTDHDRVYTWHSYVDEDCDLCGYPLLACIDCGVYVTCCPCGAHHATECPWPL